MDEYLVGHEQYSKEHSLWHVWRASKYYSAMEGIKEMLIIERRQHQDDNRIQRIAALEFVVKLLDKLTENELLEAKTELDIHFAQGRNVVQTLKETDTITP
jgi:hypothetical protein